MGLMGNAEDVVRQFFYQIQIRDLTMTLGQGYSTRQETKRGKCCVGIGIRRYGRYVASVFAIGYGKQVT